MNLISISTETIPLGQPLPFTLRGADGALLASKGYVINSTKEVLSWLDRGVRLSVDIDESGDSYRAYMARLSQMINSETSLGELAAVKMTGAAPASAPARPRQEQKYVPDWGALQLRVTQVLRAPLAGDFEGRFRPLMEELVRNCEQTPDATLLALIFLSAQEKRMYSGTHAMLVACVSMIVAREMLRWSPQRVLCVGEAGLTMNIAMTELQDQLAQQTQPLTAQQIAQVETHADRGVDLLRRLGVADPAWLEAVKCHHHRTPGPFAERPEGQQMARLIQRADVFGARLAPRALRHPMPVTAAMQASYYDETRKVDEVGAALVKALGIYPPGAFVKLASNEVGVVLRRGGTATTPKVALVTNRNGLPTGELIPRDTSQAAWKIAGVVAFRDVKVQLSLQRLMALV